MSNDSIALQWSKQKNATQYDTKEYTVEKLCKLYQDGKLQIESNGNWDIEDYRKIIELILLGMPLPTLVMSSDVNTSPLDIVTYTTVVKGSILIEAITKFVNDKLVLRDMDELDCFNGLTFKKLPIHAQRYILQKTCRIVMFDDMTDALKNIVSETYWKFYR